MEFVLFLLASAAALIALRAHRLATESKRHCDELADRLALTREQLVKLTPPAVIPPPLPPQEEEPAVPSEAAEVPVPLPTREPAIPTDAPLHRVEIPRPNAAILPPSSKPKQTALKGELPASSTKEPTDRWKPLLQKLHLWPPNQEAQGEAGLAGWWATRIGILLAVIALVFLGVYVNQTTASWMRWLELLGISLTVFIVGRWLERRHQQYGEVLEGGGLAMGFFTAFAAHGIAGVQITGSPIIGAVIQFAALATMLAWCLWKRRESLASITLGLGYVSCWFTSYHGLFDYSIAGLVLLGLTGAVLLATKRWWLPGWVAAVGSHCGFFLMANTYSSQGVTAWPSILGGAVLLGVFLFATSLQTSQATVHRRRFLLAQGGLGVLAIVGTSLLVNPNEMGAAYATLTIAFAAYTWLAYFRFEDERLFQACFLKAATFLALLVIHEFDGQTRWMALMAQAMGVLWTMRHSKHACHWLEAAFVLLWGTSFVLFAGDAFGWLFASFDLTDADRVTGWLFLALATLTATLYHQGWARLRGERAFQIWLPPFMAAGTGFGFLLSNMSSTISISPAAVSFAAGVAMVGMTLWRQNWIPLVTGGIVAPLGLVHLARLPQVERIAPWALLLFGLLISLGYVIAWLASRRYAPGSIGLRLFITTAWMGISLLAAWPLCDALAESFSQLLTFSFYALFTLAIILASRPLLARLTKPSKEAFLLRSMLTLLAGGTIVAAGSLLEPSHFPVALLGTSGLIAAAAWWRRDLAAFLSLTLPALACIVSYDLASASVIAVWTVPGDLLLGVAIVASVTWGAWLASKHQPSGDLLPWQMLDGVLHLANLSVIYQCAFRHLHTSLHWLAMSGIVVAVSVISRRWPFRVLPMLAWTPAAAMLVAALLRPLPQALTPIESLNWLAGAALLIAGYSTSPQSRRHFASAFLVWACLFWAVVMVVDAPFLSLVLALSGLLFTVLWRFTTDHRLSWAALASAAFVLITAFHFLFNRPAPEANPGLACLLITVFLLVFQGWALASANHGPVWLGYHAGTWVFAFAPLILAFLTMATPALGTVALASAGWGLASIVLFVAGLTGGLKPYRLAGLIGLLACVVRIFAVDLQDTFYRIIAFAVTAVVLLVIGYLYTRFRHWIEAHDRPAEIRI